MFSYTIFFFINFLSLYAFNPVSTFSTLIYSKQNEKVPWQLVNISLFFDILFS